MFNSKLHTSKFHIAHFQIPHCTLPNSTLHTSLHHHSHASHMQVTCQSRRGQHPRVCVCDPFALSFTSWTPWSISAQAAFHPMANGACYLVVLYLLLDPFVVRQHARKVSLIKHYFHDGYGYSTILILLGVRHGVSLSMRQLKRVLRKCGLRRRTRASLATFSELNV